MDKHKKDLKKAKDTIYRLLKIRLHSEQEIRERLTQRKLPESIITEALQYFKQLRLIDDRQFTKSWIASRLKKPYGPNRIQFELRQKGICNDILKDELQTAALECPEEDVVLQLARQKLKKYEKLDGNKQKQRIYGYLYRRGFNVNIIHQVLQKI